MLAMNEPRNIVARLHNVHTSPATLIACYHFTRRERLYYKWKSPSTIKTYADLHVNYPYFFQIINEFVSSLKIFIKATSTKFQENPSNISRHVTCGHPGRQHKQKDPCYEVNNRCFHRRFRSALQMTASPSVLVCLIFICDTVSSVHGDIQRNCRYIYI
jgi:hypothetical protein